MSLVIRIKHLKLLLQKIFMSKWPNVLRVGLLLKKFRKMERRDGYNMMNIFFMTLLMQQQQTIL